MNILQVSSMDLVGKRFNGQYLTENMHKFGHECNHLVWKKEGANENTFQMLQYPLSRKIQKGCELLEKGLSVRSLLHPSSFFLKNDVHVQRAEVVHYHLMSWPSYFSIFAFPQLTNLRPSVWTIHDFWPITGHCVYPFDCMKWQTGCGGCPYLQSNFSMRRDNTKLMWNIKDKVYKRSQFDIVVASNYVKERVEKSPLLNRFRIHHVPFGLDLDVYKPSDQNHSKKLLGIENDEIVISFRAAPGDFKGFDHIKEALKEVSTTKKICLLTFNVKGVVEEFRHKFKVVDLGWVNDEELVLNAYNATDFFLMPSMQEAFGMMAMEAMAFGKPVVVFDGTSLPEVVGGDAHGGIVVTKGDVRGLKNAIDQLIENDSFRLEKGVKALEFAKVNYPLEKHIGRLLQVYETAKNNFKPS